MSRPGGVSVCLCTLAELLRTSSRSCAVPYNAVAACRHPCPHHRHHGLRHCQLRGPLRLLPRALGQPRVGGAEAERDGRRRVPERVFRDEQQRQDDEYGRRRRGWGLPAAGQARRRGWVGSWWRRWRPAVQPQHRDTSGPLRMTNLRMYAPTFLRPFLLRRFWQFVTAAAAVDNLAKLLISGLSSLHVKESEKNTVLTEEKLTTCCNMLFGALISKLVLGAFKST